MYFVSWVIVGFVGGWLGGKVLKGDGYGMFMDIVMGMGGPRGKSKGSAAYRRSAASPRVLEWDSL